MAPSRPTEKSVASRPVPSHPVPSRPRPRANQSRPTGEKMPPNVNIHFAPAEDIFHFHVSSSINNIFRTWHVCVDLSSESKKHNSTVLNNIFLEKSRRYSEEKINVNHWRGDIKGLGLLQGKNKRWTRKRKASLQKGRNQAHFVAMGSCGLTCPKIVCFVILESLAADSRWYSGLWRNIL